jgi:hypothetical protein
VRTNGRDGFHRYRYRYFPIALQRERKKTGKNASLQSL